MFNRDRSIEEMIDSVFNNDDDEIKTNLDEDSITEEYYKAVNELEKYKISSLFVNKFCTSEEAERFEDLYQVSLEKKLDMSILDSFFLKFSNNLKKYKILYKAFKKDEEKLLKSDTKIEVKVPKQKIILKEYVNSLSDIITKLEKAIEELIDITDKVTDKDKKIPNESKIKEIKKLFETAIDSFKKIKYIEIDYEIKELTYKEYIDQSGMELYNLISPENEIVLRSIKKLCNLNSHLYASSMSKNEYLFYILNLIIVGFSASLGIIALIINSMLFGKDRKKRMLNLKTIKTLIKVLEISIKSYISLLDGFSNNVKKYVEKI